MNDVECPYCESEEEINHDDGYGYEEGRIHKQECSSCGKTYVYTTYITFDYNVDKADCLNGSEHNYKPTSTYPIEFTRMECVDCGDTRKLTEPEMSELLAKRKEV